MRSSTLSAPCSSAVVAAVWAEPLQKGQARMYACMDALHACRMRRRQPLHIRSWHDVQQRPQNQAGHAPIESRLAHCRPSTKVYMAAAARILRLQMTSWHLSPGHGGRRCLVHHCQRAEHVTTAGQVLVRTYSRAEVSGACNNSGLVARRTTGLIFPPQTLRLKTY